MSICGRIILSAPEIIRAESRNFAALLPSGESAPVFDEPWQAQAFALTVHLHAKGAFTWSEWAAALSAEIKAATARGEPDDGSHYYEFWLGALERVVRGHALVEDAALEARKQEWADAYRRTPHGKPVEL
jgi:nitrile hydratase accessory protein